MKNTNENSSWKQSGLGDLCQVREEDHQDNCMNYCVVDCH